MRSIAGVKQQQGYEGEAIVANILTGSHHVNKDIEVFAPWDITWNGLHIDVKTCKRGESATVANFTQNTNRPPQPAHDIIYVLFLMAGEQYYFWVHHSSQPFKVYGKIEDAVSQDELAGAIITCHEQYCSNPNKDVSTAELSEYHQDLLQSLLNAQKPPVTKRAMLEHIIEQAAKGEQQ